MAGDVLVDLCWDCHEPLDIETAIPVPSMPHMPEGMRGSTTRIHPECYALRDCNEVRDGR